MGYIEELPTYYKCPFCGNRNYICHYSPDWDGDEYEEWALYTCVKCGAHFYEGWWVEDVSWTSKTSNKHVYFEVRMNEHGNIYFDYYYNDPPDYGGKRFRKIKNKNEWTPRSHKDRTKMLLWVLQAIKVNLQKPKRNINNISAKCKSSNALREQSEHENWWRS